MKYTFVSSQSPLFLCSYLLQKRQKLVEEALKTISKHFQSSHRMLVWPYRTTILLLEGMHQPTVRKNRLEPKSASTGKLQVCKFFCKL